MFNTLPKTIQQQILRFLEADDFCAARDLRDAFIRWQSIEAQLLLLLFLCRKNRGGQVFS